MTENEIATIVLDVAFEIHRELGPGLLESVYEAIMEYELVNKHGLRVSRQRGIPVVWKTIRLDLGFRSDLIVEDKVIVELKSVETLPLVYSKSGINACKVDKFKTWLID